MLTLFGETWSDVWAEQAQNGKDLGVVFTRPEIARLILDLAGYSVDGPRLGAQRLLEPSCGDGAFLSEIVDRLIASEAETGGDWDDPVLLGAIRAVDIDLGFLDTARELIRTRLLEAGCPPQRSAHLAEAWTIHADFLLSDWNRPFDFIIGNPPYVRIEGLPKPLLERYRASFATLTNRADLYVAFIEKGLRLLSDNGVLAYICANRFAKNQYGGALRRLIARKYHVRYYLNLEHTQPFQADVSAYPAIIVLDRERGCPTRAATLDSLDPFTLDSVRSGGLTRSGQPALAEFGEWYRDGGPWIATCTRDFRSWEEVTERHPTLEESAPGTRVGIGVATGADKVFVVASHHPDIEASRQLPLVVSGDIGNDQIRWSGHYVINPFVSDDKTGLVDLRDYPGLSAYLERFRGVLADRHVAKARPAAWYRTIDRIWPSLRLRPKLLIPDIQKHTAIGFDEGQLYPHHNLYWIVSDGWDLRALKTILRSTIVLNQVRAYSVQMRGGSIRFQAQTLRRLRIPSLARLPVGDIKTLSGLAETEAQSEVDEAVEYIYRTAA